MKQGLTKEQQAIKEIAKHKNPYREECPNKHLWNEGFESGVAYAREVQRIVEQTRREVEKKRIAKSNEINNKLNKKA